MDVGGKITSGGLVAAGPALQGAPYDHIVFPAHLATRESQYKVVMQVVIQLQGALWLLDLHCKEPPMIT